MQFLKKNYEKILLGLVLLGLVVAVAFLPFLVAHDKQSLDDLRTSILTFPVKPLPPPDLGRYETALKLAASRPVLDLSSTNKLFNPVRWLKGPGGPVRMPAGEELKQLEITKITPLYLVVSLDSVNALDSGTRYVVVVEQQAASRPNQRNRHPYYVSVGDKKDMFNVVKVDGPAENPTLILELTDSTEHEQISIAKGKDFRRVDGYTADLNYPPENKNFSNRRVNDRLVMAAEEYNIVAINQNEVVLSAQNRKKYTIRSDAAP
jgi:hypothetical protein